MRRVSTNQYHHQHHHYHHTTNITIPSLFQRKEKLILTLLMTFSDATKSNKNLLRRCQHRQRHPHRHQHELIFTTNRTTCTADMSPYHRIIRGILSTKKQTNRKTRQQHQQQRSLTSGSTDARAAETTGTLSWTRAGRCRFAVLSRISL